MRQPCDPVPEGSGGSSSRSYGDGGGVWCFERLHLIAVLTLGVGGEVAPPWHTCHRTLHTFIHRMHMRTMRTWYDTTSASVMVVVLCHHNTIESSRRLLLQVRQEILESLWFVVSIYSFLVDGTDCVARLCGSVVGCRSPSLLHHTGHQLVVCYWIKYGDWRSGPPRKRITPFSWRCCAFTASKTRSGYSGLGV